MRGAGASVAGADRKLMTVRFGMAAAQRINRLVDPQGHGEFLGVSADGRVDTNTTRHARNLIRASIDLGKKSF